MRFSGFFVSLFLITCVDEARASASLKCTANHDLQGCVESAARAGGGIVHLTPQTYFLEKSLELASNVALEGTGPQSVITWSPSVASRINAPLLHATAVTHVAIKDVKLVGTIDQRPESQDLRNDQIGLFLTAVVILQRMKKPAAAISRCRTLKLKTVAMGSTLKARSM